MSKSKSIEPFIYTVRGHKVILDSDLARLYVVEIKRLNEQLRRNRAKFPPDFAFQLSASEWESLRSQNATLNETRGRHRKYLPYVFTEHGALQAANILNNKKAAAMSIYVIRAFVKMRQLQFIGDAILKRLAEIDSTLLTHDGEIRDIYEKLMPLLQPPPDPPKKEIGVHVRNEAR